ncbi:MAG: helix-turn-helix transcriptional regulator, partial [Bdellovibrionales bacterium]|nr:helix-turn-helix transcriptional regulator [Bdellovibrionales bacterium]
ILAAVLEAGAVDNQARSRRLQQLDHVKQFILDNLDNSDLDIDTIARERNIAPRTLNRLFAREGTTPIRWVWQQRLAASHRALSEGRISRVTDAAFEFGFKDVSHFSRAFKAAYGRSPRSVKRRR